MYNKEQFKNLVKYMNEAYGVKSYVDNIETGMTQEEIDEDLWFECPECGEPILFDDYDLTDYIEGDIFVCPVCEEEFEF